MVSVFFTLNSVTIIPVKCLISNQIQRWIPACLQELRSSMLCRPAFLSALLKRNNTLLLLYPMDWNWNGMKTCWHLTVLLKCWRQLRVCPRASADASRFLGGLSWVPLPSAASLETGGQPRLQLWPAKVTKLSRNTSFAAVSGPRSPSRSTAAG